MGLQGAEWVPCFRRAGQAASLGRAGRADVDGRGLWAEDRSPETGLSLPQASSPGSAPTAGAQAQSHSSAMQAPSYGTGAPHQWMQSWPG